MLPDIKRGQYNRHTSTTTRLMAAATSTPEESSNPVQLVPRAITTEYFTTYSAKVW